MGNPGLSSSMVYAADDANFDLADSVAMMRAATVQTMSDGQGIAVVSQSLHWPIKVHATQDMDSVHYADFRYSKSESIVKYYADQTRTNLIEAFLVRNGRLAHYSEFANASSLSIEPYNPKRSILSNPPDSWSFKELARVPGVTKDDDSVVFRGFAKRGKLDRQGNVVLASVLYDDPVVGFHKTFSGTFDLSLGGMVTSYQTDQLITKSGTKTRVLVNISDDWKRDNDRVVPGKFVTVITQSDSADETKKYFVGRVTIDFKTLRSGPQDTNDFALSSLHIRKDTIVSDQISGNRFRFAAVGDDYDYFGEHGAAQQKP
jgi:hypothetical protein